MRSLICLIVGVLLSSAAFAAQGDPQGNPNAPGNPNIWAAVQRIEAKLDALAGTGSGGSLASNIAVSPPLVYTAPGALTCAVTNLSSNPLTINISALQSNATVVPLGNATIPPAQSIFFQQPINVGGPSNCVFAIQGGTRADISATATQIVNNEIVAVVPVH